NNRRSFSNIIQERSAMTADLGERVNNDRMALEKDFLGFPLVPSYKQALTSAMEFLAADPKVIFIGYGISFGRAMGTLKNVRTEQLVEMPVAENLMVDYAIGRSIKGYKPVVFFERCDFVLLAMAAINRLDTMAEISRGEFRPTAIL